MSTFTYLLAAVAVVAVLSGRAECRPQTPETRDVEEVGGDNKQEPKTAPSPPWFRLGSVVGEIKTYTSPLQVNKQQKKRKQQQEQNTGPSASALVSGPEEVAVGGSVGASVGLSAGLALVPSQAKVEIASAR